MYEKDGKGHTDGMQKTVSRTQVIEHASRRIDLHNNVGAKLRNPLAGVPREVLMADVEAFVAEKGLENHLPAFKKGALLAQHPVSHCRPELCGLSEIGADHCDVTPPEPARPALRTCPSSHKRKRPSLPASVTTAGATRSLCTSPSPCALLAQPCRDGIRQAVTEPTCHSLRSEWHTTRMRLTACMLILSTMNRFGIDGTGRDSWLVGIINVSKTDFMLGDMVSDANFVYCFVYATCRPPHTLHRQDSAAGFQTH